MAPILNEQILMERLRAFRPEPLIAPSTAPSSATIEKAVVTDPSAIDLAKTNFLDILSNPEIETIAETTIRHYGVGTCGPRAFYGTTDSHLDLEERIAHFLGLEEAIVYSYGFVAISSSIAAYCKRSDTVFVDEKANFAIGQGLQAARCNVVTFNHNSPTDFANKIDEIVRNERKKTTRKFLIIEGVSWATGKLCPLPAFLEIAEKYKVRIFLEESYSFGVYGKTGRGLTDHFGVDIARIDMIIATLEAAVGSIGGFCAGSKLLIEHQRLSGAGYIFSASLPTYLVKTAIKSIDLMEAKPAMLQKLADLGREVHKELTNTGFEVISDAEAPFKVVRGERNAEIHRFCADKGVVFIRNDKGDLIMNLGLALAEDRGKLERVYDVLRQAATKYQL